MTLTLVKDKKNILLALFFLVSVIILLSVLYLISQKTQLQFRKKAQSLSPQPQKVMISNINSYGFTVSWITEEKTNGAVVFGQDRELLDNKREEKETSFTHSVRLTDLEPGRKYYFKIISGEKVFYKSASGEWQRTGIAETVTLPLPGENPPGSFSKEDLAFAPCPYLPGQKQQSCFRPNPVYGQIINDDESPAKAALVYLDIPGKSTLLSSLTDGQGKWVADLANLLRKDVLDYFGYLPGVDLIRISATDGKNKTISYHTIPKTTLLSGQAEPIKLTLLNPPPIPTILPTFTLTPTPPAGGPTPTAKPTIAPLGTLAFSIKLQGAENQGKNRNATIFLMKEKNLVLSPKIKLIFDKDGQYSGKFSFWKTGTYQLSIKPEGYLKKSLGTISLSKGGNSENFSEFSFLAGDLNNDNQINCLDLSLLLEQINKKTANTQDLSLLLSNYRKTGD